MTRRVHVTRVVRDHVELWYPPDLAPDTDSWYGEDLRRHWIAPDPGCAE